MSKSYSMGTCAACNDGDEQKQRLYLCESKTNVEGKEPETYAQPPALSVSFTKLTLSSRDIMNQNSDTMQQTQSSNNSPSKTTPLTTSPIKADGLLCKDYNKKGAKMRTALSARWKDADHEYDTIDDYTLMEEIKDLIEAFDPQNTMKISRLQQKIYKELQCIGFSHYKLQKRIEGIIGEIRHQQGIDIDDLPVSPDKLKICDGDIDGMTHFVFTGDILSESEDDIFIEKIKNTFKTKMDKILCKDYNKKPLKEQCQDKSCKDIIKEGTDIYKCPCIERICVFLDIYRQFHHVLNSKTAINIADYLQIDKYDSTALNDDFLHIHEIHMSQDHKIQKLICAEMKKYYHCKKSTECNIIQRRQIGRRESTQIGRSDTLMEEPEDKQKTGDKNNDLSPTLHVPLKQMTKCDSKDIIFCQLCDKIHTYFLHSNMQYGCHFDKSSSQCIDDEKKSDDAMDDEKKNDDAMDDEEEMIQRKGTSDYIGCKEDKNWIKSAEHIKVKNEQQIYERLVSKMGVFRWQGAHGFRMRGLSHLRPKYKNVKEEVLYNQFCPLSVGNWNETVTKVEQFKKSFASEKMRTKQKGSYHDQTMGHQSEWENGETPTMKEITVIKLYTDWDGLQSELKKCFRLESVDDIIEEYSLSSSKSDSSLRGNPKSKSDSALKINTLYELKLKTQLSTLYGAVSTNAILPRKGKSVKNLQEAVDSLELRLREFFHWRGNLLIFINKFSEIILPTRNNNEFILYHGVNNKMILDPSSTHSFYGPLSTTSSYYVAQTFATDKGMVLAISSQYPRLKLCNAFNASSISDYPEEQEFLIGHIYLRIRRIYTKQFKYIPIDTKIRYAFFALHLFREQMFSMNEILEDYIIPFIQIHLKEIIGINDEWLQNILKENKNKKNNNHKEYKYLQEILKWGKDHNFEENKIPKSPGIISMDDDKEGIHRTHRIFYILIKKFKEFLTEPNLKQILKIDCISPGLRPYFLKKTDEKITLKKLKNGLQDYLIQNFYIVSFKKIIALFPNTEQIHFLNWYKLDDIALEELIKEIEKPSNKLICVKFLYYDYNDPLKEHEFFKNPQTLNKTLIDKLEKLKWKISYPKVMEHRRSGYSIKLRLMK